MTDADPRTWGQEEWIGVAFVYLLAGFVLIPELLIPIPFVIAGYAFFYARGNEDYEHRPGVTAAVAFIGVLILIGAGHAIVPGGPSMDTSNSTESQAASSTVTTTVTQTLTPTPTPTSTAVTVVTNNTTLDNAGEEDDDDSHAAELYVAKRAAEGFSDDKDYDTLKLKEEKARGWEKEGDSDNHDANTAPIPEEEDKHGPQPDSAMYDDADKNELGIKEEDADGDGTPNGEDKDSSYYTGSDDDYGADGGSSGSSGDDDGIGDGDDDWGWGR